MILLFLSANLGEIDRRARSKLRRGGPSFRPFHFTLPRPEICPACQVAGAYPLPFWVMSGSRTVFVLPLQKLKWLNEKRNIRPRDRTVIPETEILTDHAWAEEGFHTLLDLMRVAGRICHRHFHEVSRFSCNDYSIIVYELVQYWQFCSAFSQRHSFHSRLR